MNRLVDKKSWYSVFMLTVINNLALFCHICHELLPLSQDVDRGFTMRKTQEITRSRTVG